jgi:PKD repeat protein
MKTKLLAFAMMLFTSMGLFAQVSGVVTNSSTQAAIANHTVYLAGDSISGIYMTTTTNAGGQYSFSNVGSSSYYDVFTYDCNQNLVQVTKYSLPATANFSICNGTSTSCQAIFNSYPDSLNPNMIYFHDVSTGNPTSWTWSFGDGTSSNLQNPTHTYASSGTYTVTLSISSATCNDSTSSQITIGTTTGCQAAFYSTPDSSNANLIMFHNTSTGNPTSYSWNFGDGSTSNAINPTHLYTAGTYTVTLSISGANCQSSTTQTIVIAGGSTNYSVSGYVMAGSNGLDAGVVKLLNSTTGAVVAQTGLDSNSMYHFNNVASGNYLVYAIPSPTSIYTTYAATYYINNILWSAATTLNVNANLTNKDVHLFQIVPMNGTGTISGNLSTGSKGAVVGAVVNLINSSNSPVASTISDMNGDYSFNNVVDGTYKVWAEIAGKTTTPIIVTINASNPNSSNNDFAVKNNTVVPKVVSIENLENELQVNAFPNPVKSQLNISISLDSYTMLNVEIINLTGQVVSSNKYELQAGTQIIRMNLDELSEGSYILRITNANGGSTNKLITKLR